MVSLLKRKLLSTQWISLLVLFIGVSVIQIQNVKSSDGSAKGNAIVGLTAVLCACLLSGMAGVYFEKILKNSNASIWTRNIQLGMFGTFFALLTVYLNDGMGVSEKGFFFGYTPLVWVNIFIQSFGGLIVAIVIKYADNILKGFATSISIIVSCVASIYLFNTEINLVFSLGTVLVVSATLLYSYTPPTPTRDREIKMESILIIPSSKTIDN
jgi:UDP-sugar transporter A1/2/3